MALTAQALDLIKRRLIALPLLLIIPLLATWYFERAPAWHDAMMAERLCSVARASTTLSAAQRAQIEEWFHEHPFSQIVRSTDPTAKIVAERCRRWASEPEMLELLRLASRFTLGLVLAAILVCLVTARLAYLSQSTQRRSLMVGWHTLKWASALILVLETGLAAELVAFFLRIQLASDDDRFVILGLWSLGLALPLVKVLLLRPPETFALDGTVLDLERAPTLAARAERFAKALGSRLPDRVVVGVDDNFFVTEHPVSIGSQVLTGSTLYLSLPLLRLLACDEAEAVLAHELAHHSGADAYHSSRLAPILWSFDRYLQELSTTRFATPVLWFMTFYRCLIELALGKTRRERELRADAESRALAGGNAAGRALLKVSAYSLFRYRVTSWLLSIEEELDVMPLALILERERRGFVCDPGIVDGLVDVQAPHPFDSHPLMEERLAALGVTFGRDTWSSVLQAPVTTSWAQEIDPHGELEAELWRELEAGLLQQHERSLALRFLPANEQEAQLVLRHFPPLRFEGQGGAVLLDPLMVRFVGWRQEEPILLHDIAKVGVEAQAFSRSLRIDYRSSDGDRMLTRFVPLKNLPNRGKDVLEALELYIQRQRAAISWQARRREEASKA